MELSRADGNVCRDLTQQLLHQALHDCVELGVAATPDVSQVRFDKKRWKTLESNAHVSVYADRTPDSAWLPLMRRQEWEYPLAVTAVGRMECSLDDVLFAVMTPNAAILKLRAFLMDHRLEKNCQLVPIETPTHDEPFRFLAATRFVNTHNWPFTMFKSPREMILAIATGYTTTAGGKACAYELIQSVELPCKGSRNNTLMSRSRALQARLFWTQDDGSSAVYCKLVVDAKNCLSDVVKQGTLCQSVLRFWKFVPRSLETKKLWWCVKNKRRLIQELRTTAPSQCAEKVATCAAKSLKSQSKRGAVTRCEFCEQELCGDPKCRRSCQLKMILSSRTGILEQMLTLCLRCATFVRNQKAADIARAQLVELDQTSYCSGASFTKVSSARNEEDSLLPSRGSTELA